MTGLRVVTLIPVKASAKAKRRLKPLLSDDERAALCIAMLADVLDAVRYAAIGETLVVGDDDGLAENAARFGAGFLAVPETHGLNGAVAAGIEWAGAAGAGAVLVVPADIPHLKPGTLQTVVDRLARPRSVALVRAPADGGTNLLALRPPDVIAPAFGPDSFSRHCAAAAAAGIDPVAIDGSEAARDIDRADDLAWFETLATRTRSQALLSQIGIARRLAAMLEAS